MLSLTMMVRRLRYDNPRYVRGFTLVELSIVLVIIGLLTAAVMAGRSLIRSAELRSVITDINGFKTAVNAYQDYHGYLPGDDPNAQSRWPPPACPDGGLQKYCNGDGDGRIEVYHDSMALSHETERAWQHLALAQLIPGTYKGFGTPYLGLSPPVIPESKLKGGGYVFGVQGPGAQPYMVERRFGISLGSGQFPALKVPENGILPGHEAASIDAKLDDGLAGSGDVKGFNAGTLTGCIINPGTDDSYNLASEAVSCRLVFLD